jgi:outer membrane autotransporter protein
MTIDSASTASRRTAPRQHRLAALKSTVAACLPKTMTSSILWSSALIATSMPAFAVEPWIMVERNMFVGADPSRGQGVTTDGTNWYFSGTNSLEITNGNYTTLNINTDAIAAQLKIPSEFSDIGLNHIGDIDYANGLLYISLDSSKKDPVTGDKYSNPVFAVYNASDLSYTGQAFALSPPNGIHDIASWVAVDAKAGLGYGMAYNNATEIAVYNLSDWSFKEYIPLKQTIDQAQGGKLLDGWMYFSTDNDDKKLMRANLATGEVEVLGDLKIDGEQEVEGLSIKWTKDGWSLNVLDREETTPGSGVEGVAFYKYLRPYGNTLSGEIHADIKGALIEDSRFVRDAANRRIRSAFDAIATPQTATTAAIDANGLHQAPANADGVVLWGEALAMTGSTSSSGYAADFDQNSAGFVAGADAPVGSWRLGVLGGYTHSNFDVSDRASSGSSDNYDLGVYAGTQLGALGFRTGAIYGWHDIDTTRNVVFPAFAESLQANYNAATAQVFGELAYRLDMGRSAIEPFVNLAYVHLNTDGFSETGGTIAALTSEDSTTQNTFSTLGARASTQFAIDKTQAALHGMLGWQHAYDDVTPTAGFAFDTGATFDISGVPIAQDALVVEAGFDLSLTNKATLGASYSGQVASDAQTHAFKVNFDLKL